MTLQIGTDVGSYHILEQIGAGGMATVYKAHQTKLDRNVALKIIHANFSQDSNFLTRFEREARIVAKLDHPNIVPIYDFDKHEEQSYLVMKCIEGLTLKQLMRKSDLSPDEIIQIMTPIADALTYAHQQGVLHRDIKPSNIIIDKQGVPYLTDFGLARVVQQGESTLSADMMLGTPHYMSPEQAKGQTVIDARTDVYSLGVILYQLTAGRVPFAGETSYAIVHDHIYTPPPPPSTINPDIPAQIEEVILKALSKEPEDRYETPLAMLDAYRQVVGYPVSESEILPRETEQVQPKSPTEGPAMVVPPMPPAPPVPPVLPSRSKRKGRRRRRDERPRNFWKKFSTGMETFGEEMEARFADFDKDEFGRPLTEREIKRKKKEAKRELKRAVRKGWIESGFNTSIKIVDEDKFYEEEYSTEEERMRRRVAVRLKKRRDEFQGVMWHLGVFIFINIWLFGLGGWIENAMDGNIVFPHIVTFFWGIGLVAHLSDYYTKYGPGYHRRQKEIEREMERERSKQHSVHMAKNKHDEYSDDSVRLTEDGEFTDSFVDEQQDDYFEGQQ